MSRDALRNADIPLISTTLINWNRADLLRRTLDSYLATVSVPFELFIIDNGSTDESRGVIEALCARVPNAGALFLDRNIGGDAFNIGLERSRADILHLSENDIEYLPGWCERALENFEAFPKLGQLSAFGPVPTDDEVWITKDCSLIHSGGRIVYQTTTNVGTTSFLRRELWDAGLRVHSVAGKHDFRFPADYQLSQDVQRLGYLVAWADHYMVRNLGHHGVEIRERLAYYLKNYDAKTLVGIDEFERRLERWAARPRPSRRSRLFPDQPLSPEKSASTSCCKNPELWSMFDGWTAEVETVEFLHAFVRLIKPRFALETGTWHGYAARAIGRAMQENGVGKLVTLETDGESADVAAARIAADGLTGIVDVLRQESLCYVPSSPIDLLFVDSALPIRRRELEYFAPSMSENAVAIIHDTGPTHSDVAEAVRALAEEGLYKMIHFHTPRGLTLVQR